MADLRTAWSDPVLPADYVEPPDTPSLSRLDAAVMPLATLRSHIGWLIAWLVPIGLVLFALLQTWRRRMAPLALLGIAAVLCCAALQQFQLAAGLLLIVLLLGVVNPRELTTAAARPLQIALLGCLVFWIAFGLTTHDWHESGLSTSKSVLLLGYELLRFPDTIR